MLDMAAARRRWPRLNAMMDVHDRFGAVGGGPLASSITLASFVSLFPLLLVVIAAIGFVSSGDATFAPGFVKDLGLRGRAAETVTNSIATAQRSRRAASLLGLVGLLGSGLGVVASLQTAVNTVWQVQGRGLMDRLVAVRWLVGAGTLFLATAALGPLVQVVPIAVIPVTLVTGVLLTTVLFVWTYHSLGNSAVGWRVHLPGALLVAGGVEILKLVSSIFLPRVVASSSALYGSLGVVFSVLAWLALYGRLIVYGAVLNVVRFERGAGTVTVEIEVPRIDGEVPLSTNRGGAVEDRAAPDADR